MNKSGISPFERRLLAHNTKASDTCQQPVEPEEVYSPNTVVIDIRETDVKNNIEAANQIAAATEFIATRFGKLECLSRTERCEATKHLTNLRRIAQELAGSRGGELYPLPECDEE